jgi:phage terminase Nu1 subunit (DNA packaging protein)
MVIDMGSAGSQQRLADLVGVSQQAISQMGIRHGSLGEMLIAYCARLREQAAGRLSAAGEGLDLVQERAALARSQREAQDMKNAVARGDFAPVGMLADVLGAASSAVVDRFDQLDGALRKACPDLPESARMAVHQVITSARNEWIRSTASLIEDQLAADESSSDEEDGGLLAEGLEE